MAEPRELPAPSIVADLCAQEAWRQAANEDTRRVLELACDTIRAVMRRCVTLARRNETAEADDPDSSMMPASVEWEFDICEGDVTAGRESAVAEVNRDDTDVPEYRGGIVTYRTLSIPAVTWYPAAADAVEVRALGRWLIQIADWLEGLK